MLYLPVIHAGYERFFAAHADAVEVLVLGTSFSDRHPILRKEIRALTPERAAAYLRLAFPSATAIRVIETGDLPDAVDQRLLVAPDEDIVREVVASHALDTRTRVRLEQTFLRWDREWSRMGRPAGYDSTTSWPQAVEQFTMQTLEVARTSSDWWRQVGAVAVRGDEVLCRAANAHRPSEYAPYFNGDPRNNYRRGVAVELSTAMHAEAAVVAWAARTGTALVGADLFVSTFPCPGCARLIADAGFARCFFAGPYAVLDGDEVLRAAGVQLHWVDVANAGALKPAN